VVHHAALLLHTRRGLGVHEVQRHLHVDLLVLRDTLEVDVLHLHLERVHVHRTQQHLLLAAVEREAEDRGVELLVPEIQEQILMLELDVDGCLVAAIDDAGDASHAAQTAARTRSLRLALARADFDCHFAYS
jgi:hypothetical protein